MTQNPDINTRTEYFILCSKINEAVISFLIITSWYVQDIWGLTARFPWFVVVYVQGQEEKRRRIARNWKLFHAHEVQKLQNINKA